jgi:hypothetical protein
MHTLAATAAPRSPVLPFAAPAAATPPGPRLTLEHFAALIAELAAAARPPAEVRARYGLDEPAHRAEAAAWQRRFAAEPALYTRWLALCQHYRAWFAQRR